jgi:glucose-1-phosphate adenylyltransferase
MAQGVMGVIVAGGDAAPLDVLGVDADALTPFAGKYRFVDFALATLLNSGIGDVHVVAAGAEPALRAHLLHAGGSRRPVVVRGRRTGVADGRAGRLRDALRACRTLVRAHRPDAVVLLFADHILHTDLRALLDMHRTCDADATLAGLPLAPGEHTSRTRLHVRDDGRVLATEPARSFALSWAGDLVLRPAALPTLLDAVRAADDERTLIAPLSASVRVLAHDVGDGRVPGTADGQGAYWHDPTDLETYYAAQMDLCTPRPALDLYNPAWPVAPVASGRAAAKVVADVAGRAGQALNSLVSDGSIIRGGVVVNTVVGHGVVVESGAEVEDSVLLDGCRIGRHARVRRALIGAGAVVGDAEQIGFGTPPPAPACTVPSGLTIVPAGHLPLS